MARKRTRRPERIHSEEKGIKAYPRRARPSSGPQDGKWYWQFMRRVDGKAVTIHPSGWYSRDEAMQVVLGYQPKASRTITNVSTVDHLVRMWLLARKKDVAHGHLSPTSYRAYRYCQRRLSKSAAGILIRRLNEDALLEIRRALLTEHSDRTTKQTMGVLRAAWAWGQARGYTPNRPLPKLRWGAPESVYNTDCPTTADASRVYEALCAATQEVGRNRPRKAERTRLLYLVIWYLGCRVTEACELRWHQVDMEAGVITLFRKGAKGRKRVGSLAVAPKLLAELAALGEGDPDERLFPGRPAVVAATLRGAIKRACAAEDIAPFTPHGLRRLASTLLIEQLDPKAYEAWMGHTYQQGLRTYAKARPARVNRAASILGPDAPAESDVIPFRRRRRDAK